MVATERRIFRVMLKNERGRPVCGVGDCMLGARVPVDIRPDAAGLVHPEGGGMSVTPDDPARLPLHFRPLSLGGVGRLPVFSLRVTELGEKLRYRPDPRRPDRHGFVEPSTSQQIGHYQEALAATAVNWKEFS